MELWNTHHTYLKPSCRSPICARETQEEANEARLIKDYGQGSQGTWRMHADAHVTRLDAIRTATMVHLQRPMKRKCDFFVHLPDDLYLRLADVTEITNLRHMQT